MERTKLSEIFNTGEHSEEWAKRCCDAIVDQSNIGGYERTRDVLCYDIFNGDTNTNTFQYLEGEGEMKYPANVRFIPIVRPLFEVLRSTESMRPLEPEVYTIDPVSIEDKRDRMYKQVVDRTIQRVTAQRDQLQLIQMQIQMMEQQVQQQAQQGGADPQIMMNLQRMQMQFRSMQDVTARAQEVVDEEMAKASKYYKYDFRTALEKAMSTGLKWWITHYSVDGLFLQGFDDLFIVDQEIYYVPDRMNGTDPMVHRISPLDYFYPAQDGATYLDELDWGMSVRWMTPSQIVEAYPEITTSQINELKEKGYDLYWSNMWYRRAYMDRSITAQGTTNHADGADSMLPYSGSSLVSDVIPVYHTTWRTWEKVTEAELVEAGVYGDLLSDDEYEEATKRPKYQYVSYVWECTRLGKDLYVNARQCPFQFRDQDVVGFSYLPYVGYAYNGVDRKPYSLVWAVRDIQELYNLVHYQMELLIALAGVKGFVMDEYQMPEGMKREEWLYYLKQGVAFIQSVKKSGKMSHYNQFQTFDMSITQGVQFLQGVLERLEYLVGRIIGVPPQRMGEIAPNDQVGTHRSAIAQSTLTTEMLFHKHRKIVNRVMNRVCQVARVAWKHGKRGQFVAGDLGQTIFELDPGVAESAAYEVFFADSSKESKIMESLTQMAGAQYNAGNIRLSQMAALFKANTLKETESLLHQFEEVAQKNLEALEQQKALSAQEAKRMEQEFKLQEKQVISAGEKLMAQLQQMQMQLDQQKNNADNQTDIAVAQIGAEAKRFDTEMDTQLGYAKLGQEAKKLSVEERLANMEMAMNAMNQKAKVAETP